MIHFSLNELSVDANAAVASRGRTNFRQDVPHSVNRSLLRHASNRLRRLEHGEHLQLPTFEDRELRRPGDNRCPDQSAN